jgi:hypothetical protein
MNLVKHGMACVFVASAALLACGSSSSDGNGSGAGTSSAGARPDSLGSAGNSGRGGSTSMSGGGSTSISGRGGTSNGQGGSTPVGSGGGCGPAMMDPNAQMCPAALDCIQTKCKSQLDAATSTTGACASYVQCANACGCDDDACVSQCTQSATCQASLQAYLTCAQSSCITEVFSCLGTGAGGSGGAGAGSGKTCADLSTCCAALTDATEKMGCTTLVTLNSDAFCDLAYANFCN